MIRRSEFAFFEIFQDPVFTIIALILFSTVPMIFPGEPKNVDPRAPALIEEVNSLGNEVRSLEGQKQELQQETASRQAEADQVAARRQQAEARRAQDAETDKQQRDLQAQLQRELEAKKREVDKLRGELGRVESRGQGPIPGKFTPIKDTTAKRDTAVQLTGNKLYPVDEAHFTSSLYPDAIVKVRKANAAGERLEDLDRPDSKLQKLLKGIDPSRDRVYLLANRDSFPILRQVRSILDRQGIEYGWFPYSRQEIVFGGGGGRLPTTSK